MWHTDMAAFQQGQEHTFITQFPEAMWLLRLKAQAQLPQSNSGYGKYTAALINT